MRVRREQLAARARRSGTTISAACEGVAARASAAKSTSVTSTSCPTALTTGTRHAATARTTASSLNAPRSSADPPPRPTMMTSTSRDALELRERPADRLGRARALHLRRREQDARAAAPERDAADVVDDRAGRARDDADDARLGGQRALALGREEPLGGELRLQRLERFEQRAASRPPAPGRRRAAAARAAPRTWAGRAAARARRRRRACACAGVTFDAVDDDVDRRVLLLVLEAEVEVPARRRARVGHLALDPDRAVRTRSSSAPLMARSSSATVSGRGGSGGGRGRPRGVKSKTRGCDRRARQRGLASPQRGLCE